MKSKVFLTCAVTGAGDSTGRNPHVPITPQQIADDAVAATKAGASIAHIHVRDPKSGDGVRDVALYRQVVEKIRSSDTDVVLNLTAGMGGDLVLGEGENPLPPAAASDMAGPLERLQHIAELLPEICTLDCGSMNFAAGGNYVMVNTPRALMTQAARVKELGVKPELEVFDSGHLVFVNDLVKKSLIASPPLVQLCMGIPYGAPAELDSLMAMAHRLPPHTIWSSFAIGRLQMPWLSAAVIAGGNVRVGLEDNIWLAKGKPATNVQLVQRAMEILSRIGVEVMSPAETREHLGLKKN